VKAEVDDVTVKLLDEDVGAEVIAAAAAAAELDARDEVDVGWFELYNAGDCPSTCWRTAAPTPRLLGAPV
jgi:hypothetical protein